MSRKKRIKQLISGIVGTALIVAAGACIIGKVQPLAVLSGSMEPSIPVGSVVFVKEIQPEKISENQVITYKISKDTYVTHRVSQVNHKEHYFVTKGDANKVEDGNKVTYDMVKGRVLTHIPYLGYISVYLRSAQGRTIVVIGAIVLILLCILRGIVNRVYRDLPI